MSEERSTWTARLAMTAGVLIVAGLGWLAFGWLFGPPPEKPAAREPVVAVTPTPQPAVPPIEQTPPPVEKPADPPSPMPTPEVKPTPMPVVPPVVAPPVVAPPVVAPKPQPQPRLPLLELNEYEKAALSGYLPMLAESARSADDTCDLKSLKPDERPAARLTERYREAFDARFVAVARPVFDGIFPDLREADRIGAELLARVMEHRIDLPPADADGKRFGRTEAERRGLFRDYRRLTDQTDAAWRVACKVPARPAYPSEEMRRQRHAVVSRCLSAFLAENRLTLAELLAVQDEASRNDWERE